MNSKKDCELLMGELVPFARQMLAKNGGFFPFGGYMCKDGTTVHAAGRVEGTENPASVDVIQVLKSHFKKLAADGNCLATGIVVDVSIVPPGAADKSDAIQINLDHKEGYTAQVFFPYHIEHDGNVEYLPVFAQEGDGEMFAGHFLQ